MNGDLTEVLVYTGPPIYRLNANTLGYEFVSWVSNASTYVYLSASQLSRAQKYVVTIGDLGSDKYYLTVPIDAILTDLGDEFVAEFPAAQIAVSEDTAEDALRWLRDWIVDSYVTFKSHREKLGPVPAQQLQILERYIGEK